MILSYHSEHEIVFRYKNMKGWSFSDIKFVHPVASYYLIVFLPIPLSSTASCFE